MIKIGLIILILFIGGVVYYNYFNAPESEIKVSEQDSSVKLQAPPKKDINMVAVSSEICDCVTDLENAISDGTRDVLMKAMENGGIDTVAAGFPDDQKEIYENEGKKARACISALQKKYPSLKQGDRTFLKALAISVEDNCSEFAAMIVKSPHF